MTARRGIGALAVELETAIERERPDLVRLELSDIADEAKIAVRTAAEGWWSTPGSELRLRRRAELLKGMALCALAIQGIDAAEAGAAVDVARAQAEVPLPEIPDLVVPPLREPKPRLLEDPHGLWAGMSEAGIPDLGPCATEKPGCTCDVCRLYDSLVCVCGVSHYDHPGFDPSDACPTGFRLVSWQGGPPAPAPERAPIAPARPPFVEVPSPGALPPRRPRHRRPPP